MFYILRGFGRASNRDRVIKLIRLGGGRDVSRGRAKRRFINSY